MTDRTARERHIRALKGIITSNAGRLLSLGFTMISVPLLINYLGADMFGAWSTVRGFSGYLQTMSLGVGYALVFAIAHSDGINQRGNVSELVSSAFFPMVGLAILIGGLVTAALIAFSITDLLGLEATDNSTRIRGVFLLLVWSMVIGTLIGILLSVRSGLQEEYKNNIWGMAGSILAVIGLILGIQLRVRIEILAVSVFFVPLVFTGANMISVIKSHPEAIPRFHAIRFSIFRRLAYQGAALTGAQVFSAILWSTDNLIIASALGAAAVVPYAVTFTIVFTAFSTIHSITTSYGPAIREAFASQDWEWLESTHRKLLTMVLNLSGGAGIWLFFWGRDTISVWVGPDIASSVKPELITILAGYLPLLIWNSVWAFPLTALGRFRWPLMVTAFEATTNLCISLWLVGHWGLIGVAVGTLTPALLVSSWAFPWLLSRVTNSHLKPEFKWLVKHTSGHLIFLAVFGFILSQMLLTQSPLTRFLVGGIPTLVISLLITAVVGFNFNLLKVRRILQGDYGLSAKISDE
jgi:O-antigen/teichoic acid export membrane protein